MTVDAVVVVVCVDVGVVVLGAVAVVVGVVAVVVVELGVVLTGAGAGVLAVGGSDEGPLTVGAWAAEQAEESAAPAPVNATAAKPPRRNTRRMEARDRAGRACVCWPSVIVNRFLARSSRTGTRSPLGAP
ncbi:MAG TPA: hypothetical protein VFW38_13125 [Solirubrobacteraceae bacterium]|nr:hypothetical protein [Solirubrobacteraceae bacterium]